MIHFKPLRLWPSLLAAAILLSLSGCGGKAPESGRTEPLSEITDTQTEQGEISLRPELSDIPDSFFVPAGQALTSYIQGGTTVDFSSTAPEIAGGTVNAVFDRTAKCAAQASSMPENGHYYRIYNQAYNSYLSSAPYDNGGLTLVQDPATAYTVWRAEEAEGGFRFETDSGFLSVSDTGSLTIGSTGSVFNPVSSRAEGCSGSFGLLTGTEQLLRLDCFSVNQISLYPDDGGQYLHTSFYFYELESGSADYAKLTIVGNAVGDTTVSVDGRSHDLYVYDPLEQIIFLNDSEESRTVRGYLLPDSETHDRGFYTYRSSAESGEITFTRSGEGKERITIGGLTYSVYTGGTECSYDGSDYLSLYHAVSAAAERVAEKRFGCQIISLRSEDLIYEGALSAGVLLRTNGCFDMGDEIMLSYTVKDNAEGGREKVVYPRLMDGRQLLFLPSSADYSRLNLHLPAGSVISSEGYEGQCTLSSSDAEADLTAIFGDMSEAGAVYSIHITWQTDSFSIEQELDLIRSQNIPLLFFDIEEEGVEDMVEWLNTDKTHRTKGGKALFLNADGTIRYEGSINNIHMRGNSNTGSPYLKPGYGVKFSHKLALTEDGIKAKTWCLVPHNVSYRDTTTFATAVGDTLYQRMNSQPGDDYAIRYLPVDLYINGEYRGVYLMTEKANDRRISIHTSTYTLKDEDHVTYVSDPADPAITAGVQGYYYATNSTLADGGAGGFIIEVCGFISSNSCGFVSRRGIPLEIKEPGCATQQQVQQIAMYYQKFEDALYSDNGCCEDGTALADLIDLNSFGKLYVLKAFLQDMDFFWGSTYMYIDADASGFLSPLKCCTAWDFDSCQTIVGGATEELFSSILSGNNSAVDYKWQLLEHEDFVQTIRTLSREKVFEENSMSFTDLVRALCSDGSFIDEYYETVDPAMSMNRVLWSECGWADTEPTSATIVKNNLLTHADLWDNLMSGSGLPGGIPPRAG